VVDAVLFDLDDTLVDTRGLREYRDAGEWAVCLSHLDMAKEFTVGGDGISAASLPRLISESGLKTGHRSNQRPGRFFCHPS
jgi:FMN phosphatase YigB (HAD superfamily)